MIKYLAGIFDAEGYVRIRKTMSGGKYFYTPEAKLYMCDKQIIQSLADIYSLVIKSESRGVDRKTTYYVSLGVKVLRSTSFLQDFLPYLNEKRLQLEQVKHLIEGTLDKELCYNNYMEAKIVFNHPVIGDLSFEYLAGIIDGDGWLSMFNSGKGASMYNKYAVGLQQRYKPMVEYMTKFGGSDVHKCKVYDYQSHVQTWSWQCTTSEVLPFLKNIYPHLIEKRDRCKLLIKYIEDYEKFREYSKQVLEQW